MNSLFDVASLSNMCIDSYCEAPIYGWGLFKESLLWKLRTKTTKENYIFLLITSSR